MQKRISFSSPQSGFSSGFSSTSLPSTDMALKCANLCMPSFSRDGGTGRRSGLKIRRCLAPWGFNSPSRHQHFSHQQVTNASSSFLAIL